MARIAAVEADLDKKFKFDKKEDIIAAIEADLGKVSKPCFAKKSLWAIHLRIPRLLQVSLTSRWAATPIAATRRILFQMPEARRCADADDAENAALK